MSILDELKDGVKEQRKPKKVSMTLRLEEIIHQSIEAFAKRKNFKHTADAGTRFLLLGIKHYEAETGDVVIREQEEED